MKRVRASGGSGLDLVRFGLLPQVLPVLGSQVLYYFESNARQSTIVGIVGAGGLGLHLAEQIRMLEWQKVSFLVLMNAADGRRHIDFISTRLRFTLIGRPAQPDALRVWPPPFSVIGACSSAETALLPKHKKAPSPAPSPREQAVEDEPAPAPNPHSGLILPASITCFTLRSADLIRSANSAGLVATGETAHVFHLLDGLRLLHEARISSDSFFVISSGVPAGARKPCHATASKPGTNSAMAGILDQTPPASAW